MDDDQFPIDKPELANAAFSRFRETQESAVVRDLASSLREREAELARLKDRVLSLERAINTFGQEAFWVTRPSTRFSGSVDWVWSRRGSPIEFVRETLEDIDVSAGG